MTATVPVAAIVPLYNGCRFIGEALASILAQRPRPSEIVVIDDGSTDGGAARLHSHAGIRLIRQANRGEAAARNRGIRETVAPLLAFLDHDDLWLPGKLALQVPCLEADPAIDLVYSQHRLVVEDGADGFRRSALDRPLTAELPGSMIVRRSAFARLGLFREDLRLGSDVDWILRARDAGLGCRLVEKVLLLRRLHGANASRDDAAFMAGLLRAARDSIHRKRSRV